MSGIDKPAASGPESSGRRVSTDTELVRAAQAGDVASLGALFGRHRAAMYAVALSMLGAGPDAEDAVQDAALIAIGRLGDLRDPGAAGAWLRGIVRNVCRALRRRDRWVPAVQLIRPACDRLRCWWLWWRAG